MHCLRFFLLLATMLLVAVPAHAKRVALVIGNSGYKFTDPLRNPVNDANMLSQAIGRLPFDKITTLTDLNAQQMRAALAAFERDAVDAEIALVYFAGHGIEVEGQNYLIPIDARLARSNDVQLEAISLSAVTNSVRGAKALRLIIMDACRNNPFRAKMGDAGRRRSLNRGLAAVETEDNELIAFAAASGAEAEDGTGEHSPFTAALLKHIEKPGLEIRLLFGEIRDDVRTATSFQQTPYVAGTLGRTQIFLKQASLQAPSAARGTTEQFKDCPLCPEMVAVPAGAFPMGATPNDYATLSPEVRKYLEVFRHTESPRRNLFVSAPFAVGKFEVTVANWKACVSANGCPPLPPTLWSDDQHPVLNVSWDDAQRYLKWLSQRSGKTYRLLTEAEWEYAARAGTTSPYVHGDQLTPRDAQFSSLHPERVGRYQPNMWGMHDMHGNAAEWVEDCWAPTHDARPLDSSARADGDCERRVVRGGAWAQSRDFLRSAFRMPLRKTTRIDSVGFRVARSMN